MTVAALNAAVQARIGSARLKQITNDSNTATTVNDTVLNGACADAIGQFERMVGITHDTSSYSHLAILVKGVLAFLESYKGRETALATNAQKEFVRDCLSFRETAYGLPQTNSNLSVTRESSGTRADADRNRSVWPSRSRASKPIESYEEDYQ